MAEIYLVEYTYPTDTTLQDQHRPAHLAYIRERIEHGDLLVSGPWGPGEYPGAALIIGLRTGPGSRRSSATTRS